IHLFNVDRPGQCRGVPELTPSLPLIPFVRRYTLATVAAAEIAANYAAVLKTQTGFFSDDDAEVFKPYSAVEIERGMMAALPYGYELQQLKAEQPTANFAEFRASLLMEIARPIHMPRNKVLGDSSGYNFSSAKMDDQIYYHSIDIERGDWDVDALDRIFEWWLDEALFVPGFLDLPQMDYVPRVWTWPKPKSVQPLQDAKATTHLIESGLLLEETYLHSQQVDPDTFYAARAEQAERRAALQRIANDARQLARPTSADIPNRIAA
ncbi:MAG: phage portal protein, partial [Planctomycetales bacterium]|nr:phage portal protein [Planctomycetales bacterium]